MAMLASQTFYDFFAEEKSMCAYLNVTLVRQIFFFSYAVWPRNSRSVSFSFISYFQLLLNFSNNLVQYFIALFDPPS